MEPTRIWGSTQEQALRHHRLRYDKGGRYAAACREISERFSDEIETAWQRQRLLRVVAGRRS